jgi:hypothetical protein
MFYLVRYVLKRALAPIPILLVVSAYVEATRALPAFPKTEAAHE